MEINCRGCKLYDYDDPECCCQIGIPPYKDSRKCPCTECIVKSICTDVCSHLIDYMWLFYERETDIIFDITFQFRVHIIKEIRGKMTIANKNLYTMCEGCTIYGYIITLKPDLDIYHRDCNIEYPILSDCQCPCINCIVKGICNNVCRELLEYKHKADQAILTKVKEYKGVKRGREKRDHN